MEQRATAAAQRGGAEQPWLPESERGEQAHESWTRSCRSAWNMYCRFVTDMATGNAPCHRSAFRCRRGLVEEGAGHAEVGVVPRTWVEAVN